MNASLPDPLYMAELIQKHLQGNLTEKEKRELNQWIAASEANQQVWKEFSDGVDLQLITATLSKYNEEHALEQFLEKHAETVTEEKKSKVIVLRKWRWVAAAAVLLLLSVSGYLFFINTPSAKPAVVVQQPQQDVQPGKKGAFLILANGTRLLLDSMQNGVVALQNGTKAILKNGELVYVPSNDQNGEMVFNTISVPNGRVFQLALPDETKVWLNSGSTIRYPVAFTGSQRQVAITGEAYFEVTKNRKMPFRVRIEDRAEVEVLGTHFNINAYDNEETLNTTLLEGSVRVTAKREGFPDAPYIQVLQPGQQMQLGEKGIHIVEPDIDKVMAWKNGLFNFDGMDLKSALKQIARWYDVEIVYKDKVPDIKFYGNISRDISLKGLIKGFEGSGVHLSIQNGKELVVMP